MNYYLCCLVEPIGFAPKGPKDPLSSLTSQKRFSYASSSIHMSSTEYKCKDTEKNARVSLSCLLFAVLSGLARPLSQYVHTTGKVFRFKKYSGIHTRMYSESLTVYIGKSIWVSHSFVLTQTVFSYLRTDVNRHKFYPMLPWTNKKSFQPLFIIASVIKNCPSRCRLLLL